MTDTIIGMSIMPTRVAVGSSTCVTIVMLWFALVACDSETTVATGSGVQNVWILETLEGPQEVELSPEMEVCLGYFLLPDEARAEIITFGEQADLVGRTVTRVRSISLEDARGTSSRLWEPGYLPEGFTLSNVEVEEKKDRNKVDGPYKPCRFSLTYSHLDSAFPWLEVEQPTCTLGGGVRPTEGETGSRQSIEDSQRDVEINGKSGHIVDWPGRDWVALQMFEFDGCVKASRAPIFGDSVLVSIAESLQ